jgi:myo-inositol-1(or 4)-monophosphatase
MRQELFTATRGGGARLNDRRLRINPQTKLEGSLIATGFPYYRYDYLDKYMAILKDVITRTAGVRRPGSAALDLAHTAAGRFDGFWEFNLKAWDIAAGALLVREAGGIVSDFKNEGGFLENGNIVCGAPRVHEELLEIITQHNS